MAQKRKPRERDKCGTISGYRQHVRLKERPCQACREANREYMREKRDRMAAGEKPRISRREKNRADEIRGAKIEAQQHGDTHYPSFLRARGKRLWDELSEQFELTPQLRELVTEACRLADRLERMAAALSSSSTLWFELGDPEEVETGDVKVQIVVNSLLSEARQTQSALSTLLNRIGVVEKATAKAKGESLTDQLAERRAQRMAEAKKKTKVKKVVDG